MRKVFLLFVVPLFVLTAAGCGGGGGGTAVPSPFAGHWIGTFSTPPNASGTADLTISTTGAALGTANNTQQGVVGAVDGNITSAGSITATCDYGPAYLLGYGSGVLVIGGNGHLTGTIAWHNGATDMGTSTFDLVKQ